MVNWDPRNPKPAIDRWLITNRQVQLPDPDAAASTAGAKGNRKAAPGNKMEVPGPCLNETLVFLAFHPGGGIKTDRKTDCWQLAEFLFQFFFLWDLLVDIKSLILRKGPKIQKVVKSKTTLVFRLRWKDGFHVPSTHGEIHYFGWLEPPPLNHLLCFFASCWRCSDVLLLDLCKSFLILIRHYCISK